MPAETPPPSPPPSAAPPAAVPRPAAAAAPYRRTRLLHLAAAIDGRGRHTADHYVELARLAERGALDFVTLGGGAGGGVLDALDALDLLAVLARVASATDRIGLVPAMAAASAAPAELARSVAGLDRVSQGRAGWTVTAPEGGPAGGGDGTEAAAGQPAPKRAEARWRAAADVVGTAVLAWDTLEGAEHRPPQGRPVLAVDATEPAARSTAARYADIAFVRSACQVQADRIRTELRGRAAEWGRDPDRLLVLGELRVDLGGAELGPESGTVVAPVPDGSGGALFRGGPVDLAELMADWQRAGAVDGFHAVPVEPRRDLERFVNGTAALLQHRGLFRAFHPGATLREHLGLQRPAGAARDGRPGGSRLRTG
ncbi:LLM class flavin-dependent oxidoreductase [Actinacidiphila sp. ITFR-21]|uniref:LLM class flavin-dependent oxidoreductase n=1 Tax=Actinacidiphila sp. ITFR-21 TaxID=3075199 RepID=UPI00288A7E31|nr:LLM class flavin-dependent oxidoreductase [Streptomyces sp. ITFR-21]WNI14897.1 LLM class flavin-dependent oxidoreductase [Streptomyces sp. ITFR-21]